MSADFQFYQTYGAGATDVPQGTGAGSNDWDYKNADTPGPASASEAINAGNFSYQVFVRAKFTQPSSGPAFSAVTNCKYYASDLNLSGYGDGSYVISSGLTSYPGPSVASMSGTWLPIPTVSTSGVDISTAALAGGTAGYTDWVGSQLKTTATNALAGAGGLISFTLVYDEV